MRESHKTMKFDGELCAVWSRVNQAWLLLWAPHRTEPATLLRVLPTRADVMAVVEDMLQFDITESIAVQRFDARPLCSRCAEPLVIDAKPNADGEFLCRFFTCHKEEWS